MKHKKKEIGSTTYFNLKREEVGRIKLTDWTSLVASVVNDEFFDLRLWIDSDDFRGWSKKGLRFWMFEGHWEEFKELVERADEKYEEALEKYEEALTQAEDAPLRFSSDRRKVTQKI